MTGVNSLHINTMPRTLVHASAHRVQIPLSSETSLNSLNSRAITTLGLVNGTEVVANVAKHRGGG